MYWNQESVNVVVFSFYIHKHNHWQLNLSNKECWHLVKATPSFVFTICHGAAQRNNIFYFHTLFDTVTTWFSPRALKSCWRSSSRPDTRWCSPLRVWSGPTDTWRTNTLMSGRATGSLAQGVGPPVLSVTQLGQATSYTLLHWSTGGSILAKKCNIEPAKKKLHAGKHGWKQHMIYS